MVDNQQPDEYNPTGLSQTPLEVVEEKYPVTLEAFRDIQAEQLELFAKKMLDYGPRNITLGRDISDPNNKTMSLQNIWLRMSDKMERMLNLLWKHTKPQNEPITDSWLDISNYSIISLLIHRNKWGE